MTWPSNARSLFGALGKGFGMYRTIVVGYDGTKHSEDGLALAAKLAQVSGARLILAFSYGAESIPLEIGAASIGVSLRDWADEVLARGLRLVPGSIDATARPLRSSSAPRALHGLAEEEGADLVVLGSTSLGPVGRVLIGSVASRLLNGLPCPIAVAPKGFAATDTAPSGKIGVCWDGSPESRLAAEAAAGLAQVAEAELRLLMVLDPTTTVAFPGYLGAYVPDGEELEAEAAADIAAALEGLPGELEACGSVLHGPAAATLADHAAGERLDMLVCGSRGYGPLRSVLLGGVSAELMRIAPCPVLVVPRSAVRGQAGSERATAVGHSGAG